MKTLLAAVLLGGFTYSGSAAADDLTDAQKARSDAELAAAKSETKTAEAQGDAKVAKATADAEVTKANAKADEAKAAQQKAQQQLDEARSGKLIKYGVTAGFSVVGQSRSVADGTAGSSQRSFNLTTMPYLVLAPAYWFKSDQVSTYCASKYVDADQAAAASAAFERAKKIARVGLTRQEQLDLDSPDATTKAAAEQVLDAAARKIFDPKLSAVCWTTKLGFYLGKPADYDGSVRAATGESEAKRSVQSTLSTGVAFIPNAYVTILFGVTAANITEPARAADGATPAQPEAVRRFVNLTFGVGGNLDLLSAIFK
jgi:hypothetical protein